MPHPAAGRDYPGSYGELLAWFGDDDACLDYLDWLRWREGWRRPACACERGWRLASGRRECAGCGRQSSVTAGTIFHRTRTPLTVWFAAASQHVVSPPSWRHERRGPPRERCLRAFPSERLVGPTGVLAAECLVSHQREADQYERRAGEPLGSFSPDLAKTNPEPKAEL